MLLGVTDEKLCATPENAFWERCQLDKFENFEKAGTKKAQRVQPKQTSLSKFFVTRSGCSSADFRLCGKRGM